MIGSRLGVGGERSRPGAVEVDVADRLEVVGHLDRQPARLHQGPGGAGVADHVGVGRAAPEERVPRTGEQFEALRLGDGVSPDVPVAVPLRPAVAETDAVDHAVPMNQWCVRMSTGPMGFGPLRR